MRVRHSEGVAIHIGPKPCGGIREDVVEASAGERIGQPLSRESDFPRVPTTLPYRKATWQDASSRASDRPCVVFRPWHVRTLLVREPGDLQLDPGTGVRIGKARSRSR